ncbi:MAG: hypothetical protein HDR88_03545 [Bacteroides sp.]|nr:hypothetical protein [Bacteroides sp.]
MKIIIVMLFLLSSLSVAYAQEATVTMSMTEYEMTKSKTDSLLLILSNNQVEIDSLNTSLREQNSVIKRLRGQLKDLSSLYQGNDSLILTLKDSLSIQANEIARLKVEVASLDMVRLRYANGRLQLPYNQEKINEAIELFNGISDENLKNECSEILSWLRQYNFYLREVKDLIQSLQSDTRRENKFDFDAWRSYALKSINQNGYVKDSHGHYFTIIFLDEIISIAKNRLTKATKPTVDFSDLIDRLQL